MMQARLSASLWVDALVRRANVGAASAFVISRGDAERGDVLIKVSTLNGQARLYRPTIDLDGQRIFLDMMVQGIGPDEIDIDAYILRESARDPDVWIVEIEDRDGRHFITEAVQDS